MIMYGLEAISHNNGWAISVVGILIVFTGLVTLSMVIRIFPKIIALIEGNGKPKTQPTEPHKTKSQQKKSEPSIDSSIKEAVRQYQFLISWMGEPFSLPRLVELAQKRGLDRPHATISKMIHASVIQPDGKGYFLWHAR
jgi:Na+-transporting methylmalonyl-CoA/oxaloacetate decarboxylase gamma subunit